MKKKKRKKPKDKLNSWDYLDAEQVLFCLTLLKKEADDGGFRACVRLFVFRLLLITGLRRAEACGIEMRDLPCCHGKKQIDVRREVGKGGYARTITLSTAQVGLIDQYIDRFCNREKQRSPLLLNEAGVRMKGKNIWCRMKTIGRHVGIPSLKPHAMRHTYSSLLYQQGGKDQMFVKDQCGHRKVETTNIYVHIGSTERIRQVSRLDWLTR